MRAGGGQSWPPSRLCPPPAGPAPTLGSTLVRTEVLRQNYRSETLRGVCARATVLLSTKAHWERGTHWPCGRESCSRDRGVRKAVGSAGAEGRREGGERGPRVRGRHADRRACTCSRRPSTRAGRGGMRRAAAAPLTAAGFRDERKRFTHEAGGAQTVTEPGNGNGHWESSSVSSRRAWPREPLRFLRSLEWPRAAALRTGPPPTPGASPKRRKGGPGAPTPPLPRGREAETALPWGLSALQRSPRDHARWGRVVLIPGTVEDGHGEKWDPGDWPSRAPVRLLEEPAV